MMRKLLTGREVETGT